MIRELNRLIGEYVFIRTALMPGYYEVCGKISRVTPDALTLTTFNDDGTDPQSEIFPIGTLLMVATGAPELNRLKAAVCLQLEAATRDR